MSEMASKLERVQLHDGRARRRLSTLRACAGFAVLSGTEKRPERVTICPMDRPTTWRRVDGDMDKDAFYEVEG
jgi:hypothetical protein